MFSPDSDYEMEDETIQARLLRSAEQTLDRLEAAHELADHQGANRVVYEWLDEVETYGTIIFLTPELPWHSSVSSCLRWASLLAASFRFGQRLYGLRRSKANGIRTHWFWRPPSREQTVDG